MLFDINLELLKSQVLDLKDTLFLSKKTRIRAATENDSIFCEADIAIFTAGSKQREGEDRISLLQRNKAILKSTIDRLKLTKTSIFIVVSNPVEILIFWAREILDLPTE